MNDFNIRNSDEKKVKIEKKYRKKYIKIQILNEIYEELNKLYITNILNGQKEEIKMSFINKPGGKLFFNF